MNAVANLNKAAELIRKKQGGFTQAELAAMMEVNRSTVHRWIPDLEKYHGIKLDDHDYHLKIDLDHAKINFEFTIDEVQGICLGMRMLARKFWFPYDDAVKVMDKLAEGTRRFSDILSEQIRQTGICVKNRSKTDSPKGKEIQTYLKRLTKAIAEHKQVTFKYKKSESHSEQIYKMNPYALEPYPEGNGLYLICQYPADADKDKFWRKFRFTGMRDIEVNARNLFTPDPGFIIEKTTINAWGIWDDQNQEPKTVKLKFSPAIAERVTSSNWHESEVTETLPDGSLLFSVTVAEPLEMLPWIRGWGANVEILEPAELREGFREEVKRMMGAYGVK